MKYAVTNEEFLGGLASIIWMMAFFTVCCGFLILAGAEWAFAFWWNMMLFPTIGIFLVLMFMFIAWLDTPKD